MKHFLVILFSLLLLVSAGNVKASNCSYQLFIEKHANLNLCQNYMRDNSLSLLYKARTKALSDYIALKIEHGKLKDKKFEIEIYDPILSHPHVQLSQSKTAYYVLTGGKYINLEELMVIVDRFTDPKFSYIEINHLNFDSKKDKEKEEKRLDRFYKRQLSEDDKQLKFEYTMWQSGLLSIHYQSDKLSYVLANKTLPIKVKTKPAVIHNRYIIPTALEGDYAIDYFFVYQDSVQIKKFKLFEMLDEESTKGHVYDKWVNIGYSNRYFYSYSYDENKFYYFDKPIEID